MAASSSNASILLPNSFSTIVSPTTTIADANHTTNTFNRCSCMTTNKTSPSDVSNYNPPLPPPPPVPHLPPPHKKIRSGHLNLISLHQATHSRTFDADNYIQYFYRSFQDYDEGLDHEANVRKMRLLSFIQMAESQSEMSFELLMQELQLATEQVEGFIIEGTQVIKMADGMLSLAWNNHSSTFCHMLSTVRDAELYTDVTIACDGKFYPAHKLVLSTCSDYFHKIFERTPCKHPVIVIKDVESKNMEALLNYMYAGVVNVSQSDLAQLIRAAELLEIKGLAVPDEPPSGSKRPVQTRNTCVEANPNPKRQRQEEKTSNQEETPHVDSSILSSQSSSLGRDDSLEEQMNTYDAYDKGTQRHVQGDHRQDRKDSLSCGRRSEQLPTEGLDHLDPTGGSQNEVASEGVVKEEKVEPDSESEATDMGYEYDSLMTDLMGGGGGEAKEHSASMEPFNQSLSQDSYSAEAGPSGLQVWPGLGDGMEAGSQGYSGGLPLPSHPGQPPHQLQHMAMEGSDVEDGSNGVGLKSHKIHHCPYCPYSADFNYLLLRHIRTHTGEKPYYCPLCSYRASRKDSLKQHMLTHIPQAKTE